MVRCVLRIAPLSLWKINAEGNCEGAIRNARSKIFIFSR